MVSIKESHKMLHLYGFAFLGGTCLSLVELADLIKHNPHDINIYFFAGLILAGIFGCFALILAGNDKVDRKISFMIGMSAPQIIGGVIKGGSIAKSTAFFGLLASPVYAAEVPTSIMPDTNEIIVTVKGTNEKVTIVDEETDKEYTATYEEPVVIPRSGKYSIKTKNASGKVIDINEGYSVDSTKQLDIIVIKKRRTLSVFQGLFSAQHKNHGAITQKITVQEKNIPVEDTTVVEDTLTVEDE